MNNLDFFEDYLSKKNKADSIFKSVEQKFKPKESIGLNEAFFNFFNSKKSEEKQRKIREAEIETVFYNAIKDPDLQEYFIQVEEGGEYNTSIPIKSATQKQIDSAWNIINKKAKESDFFGKLKIVNGDIVFEAESEYQKPEDKATAEDEGGVNDEEESLDSQEGSQNTYELVRAKNGIYYFGSTDRSAFIIDNAQSQIDSYNWSESPLRWLFEDDLKFELKSISFDFKRGVILSVDSINWEGSFAGKTFKGVYKGESFKGNFFGKNDDFQASPTAFVDGVFYDSTKTGILGLDDIYEADGETDFNLIQVPVGYSIEMLTNNQIRHTITVNKRLDERDSNFVYTVYLGYDIDYSNPIESVIAWDQIRQEYDNYTINKNLKYIPNLLNLQNGEEIIELKILKTGTPPVFKQKERFNPNVNYEALLYGYKMNIDIQNQNDFEKFTKMKAYANSSQFSSDLKTVAELINDGIIDAKYLNNFPYLKTFLVDLFRGQNITEVGLIKGKNKTRYNDFNKAGEFINTFTGRRIKTKADIQEFLHTKYRDYYSRYGEYPREYEKEYNELYNRIIRRNKEQSSYFSSANQPISKFKEQDTAFNRLENFVIYFVNKINMGEKTNQMKSFILNNIIKKNIQKNLTKKSDISPTGNVGAQNVGTTTGKESEVSPAKTGSSKKTGVKPQGPLNLKESIVRGMIRKYISSL